MRLSIQCIVASLFISTSDVMAENLIRYLFNNGEAQSGLECSPSEIEKIEAIFHSVQTPLNLRKRDVEIKERLLQFNSENIHTLDLDGIDSNQNRDIAEYHLPSCSDSCEGYLPDTCFAFVQKGFRRDLSAKERQLPKSSGNTTAANTDGAATQGTYPSYCAARCSGFQDGECRAQGCVGYRRHLEELNEQDERKLPKSSGNTTAANTDGAVTQGGYPSYCAARCSGFQDGECRAQGCVGYRRALTEVQAPEKWCVDAAQAIDKKLNELLIQHQVSAQCQALILAPRRMECYNDEAIC